MKVVRGDAESGELRVADPNRRVVALGVERALHQQARARAGVGDQVYEDLGEPGPIGEDVIGVQMSASIRVAVGVDAGEIAELGNQLGYDLGTPETADRIRRILLRNDQRVVVAEVNGALVGWVHAIFAEYFEAEAFVLIGGLVVDRNHVGRGLPACSWRLPKRSGAHRFYEPIGYQHIKTQYVFVKALDVAHRKDIGRFVPKVED